MLHHISISVDNPLRVAKVLAQILHGHVVPFAICPGSYIVLQGDEYGTAIELLPFGIEMTLKHQKVVYMHSNNHSQFSATYATISVPISQCEIEQIAMREDWHINLSNCGQFKLIELWIENKFLLELMSPTMTHQYIESMNVTKLGSPK